MANGTEKLQHARRQRAALVSLAAGILIFATKLLAWRLTGSTAILSDALESIVNVVAAGFAVVAVRFAAQPADREHPYGHGKIEFVSAAFEGGLITFASATILLQAGRAFLEQQGPRHAGLGLLVTSAAGLGNLVLGAWLVRTGRAAKSATLEADGEHVLSDVWTTVGVLAGLALVWLTGWWWLDPLTAAGVGVALAVTGVRLVRRSMGALLDTQDPELVERLTQAFNEVAAPWLGGVHRMRVQRFGAEIHVDADVFVPEHWSLRDAHDRASELGRRVIERAGLVGEMSLHLDPCRHRHCARCDEADCPGRRQPFTDHRPLSIDEVVRPGAESGA